MQDVDRKLRKKLEHRGHRTDLVFSIHDVAISLEMINENEQELEGKPNIILSASDQLEILNVCVDSSIDEIHTILNTKIGHYILDNYDNPKYYERKN